MKTYKSEVVSQNTGGIEFLMKKNKIDWLKGWASIPEAGKVKVGDDVHETKNIVIASGSVPSSLPGVEVDNDKGIVIDSTGALDLPKIPKKMTVIGAGVIGLELGSVYAPPRHRRNRCGIHGCGLPGHGCRRTTHLQAHP